MSKVNGAATQKTPAHGMQTWFCESRSAGSAPKAKVHTTGTEVRVPASGGAETEPCLERSAVSLRSRGFFSAAT